MWEATRDYREMGEDFERLRRGFDWLTELQLRMAIACAEADPDEIHEHLQQEAQCTPEKSGRHAGLLFVSPSVPGEAFDEIALALIQYDRSHGDGMVAYQIDCLIRI